MEVIIGIDPGQKGALAFYNPNRLIVYPTPVFTTEYMKSVKGKQVKRKRTEMSLDETVGLIHAVYRDHGFVIKCAYIEHVTAMEKQGVTGMFRFGQNFGQWQGILAALDIETHLIRPQIWKRQCGLIGEQKNGSLDLARSVFPNNGDNFRLKKHDGLAEAALIARYGWQTTYVQ